MQTFLPYPNFTDSAKCLDYRRLGKQRIECKQIYRALTAQSTGWANHPAVKMWRGHTSSLLAYAIVMCLEWRDRGYEDNQLAYFREQPVTPPFGTPKWLGDQAFHAAHRSNLLRKDPVFYGKFNWREPPNLEYIWPIP